MATQTRTIKISVDAPGVKAALDSIASSMGSVNKNTAQVAKSMSFMSNATQTWLGLISVRELASFSDEIQNLQNKLVSMTGNLDDAGKAMGGLIGISRSTNQSLGAVADTYFRMSQALKDIGISQQGLFDATETIANTFRLSGASAQEAANATIQLGQAFSLGVLRGQDLRSVMSQNLTLTRLLRKEFGNDLIKQAEKGLITVPRIFKVLNENMKEVNETAAKMKPTFEQNVIKIMDAVKLQIFGVVQSLGAGDGFTAVTNFAIKNAGLLGAAMLTMGSVLSVNLIPQVISLAKYFGLLNPYVLVIGALTAGFLSLAPAVISNLNPLQQLAYAWHTFALAILGDLEIVFNILGKVPGNKGKLAKMIDEMLIKGMNKQVAAMDEYKVKAKEMEEANKKLAEAEAARLKRQAEDMKKLEKLLPKQTPEQMLEELNKQYQKGIVSVSEYNQKILEFDLKEAEYKFLDGKIKLEQLQDAINRVELFKLNRDFNSGAISVAEFSKKISDIRMSALKQDLDSGKISLQEFDIKMAEVADKFSITGAFRAGLQDYLKSIGSTTKQVADAIKGAFSGLENIFLEFIKNGKANFKDFAQAILDDLSRIIIRATIIAPLAQGILQGVGFGATGGANSAGQSYAPVHTYAAHGMAFDKGITKFASGGIIDRATAFGYGKGKMGVLGEAGPEAILPLKRGSSGDLGVQASITPVTVNVINQSGNEVQQSESMGPNGEKQIDILITNKVREGIVSGRYDKVFKNSYGLNRKGS